MEVGVRRLLGQAPARPDRPDRVALTAEARLLGSGGWLPTDARETACVYLRSGSVVLTLDAGTGLRRLVTEPELLDGVEELHIALSHYHLDHTTGLLAVPAFFSSVRCHVWGGGRALYGMPADGLLDRLLGFPFLSPPDERLQDSVTIHDLDGTAEVGPFRVETRVQPLHSGPTLALKVDGWLAYCTDTAYDEENAGFVRGARVLLHEAMHASDTTDDPMHSAAGEAARVAAAAGVEELVLVHVNPTPGAEVGLLEGAAARFESARLGHDGLAV